MHRGLKAFLFALTCWLAVFPYAVFAAGGSQRPPKLLNLFIGYLLTDEDVAALAKWDIVVLDMDQQFQFPDQVKKLRALNPRVKILAYVSGSEISDARFRGDPASPGYKLASAIPEGWFMHHPDGSRASWWPQTSLLNATDLSPTDGEGVRWNTFLGPFIQRELMPSGLWDGVFLDAAYGELTPTFGPMLDPDQDGAVNDPRQTDQAWREGMKKLIKNMRSAIGPGKLILNNSSSAYAPLTNGTLFENFPRFGWVAPFQELRVALTQNVSPRISAINTNTNNQETPWAYRLMRYGFASALVADSYYSFDAGDAGHHRTWWYDEYEAALGSPKVAARVVQGSSSALPVAWSRTYQNGMVFVNATKKSVTVSLPGEYEHLSGSQDPSVNDGTIVNRVTIGAEDGLVLLRRAEVAAVQDAQYTNGDFLQVYNEKGERVRNGFFATRGDVPGGARALVTDLDRDGLEDVVFSQNGQVTVRLGKGSSSSFRPYGKTYRGGIEIAAGQANQTPFFELVLAPSGPLPSTVLVTDLRGRAVHSWLAYRKEFVGGLTVGFGDVDGNGLREIVTGAGPGGGPHARIFRTDGGVWGGSFFAFDPAYAGGANVAVGDVDGDGKDEIVVGSGKGDIPRVRIFDGAGKLKSEFTINTSPSPVGVKPVVADLDGTGKAFILIPRSAF